MRQMPVINRVCDIRTGKLPELEAWIYYFLAENNIEHLLNPSSVASAEQLRFMVALKDDQVYIPCEDTLFLDMYTQDKNKALLREYIKVWRFLVRLVAAYNMNRADTRRITSLCRYRFKKYLTARILLPSRMIKRLVGIVLTQRGDLDPFRGKKHLANAHAAEMFYSASFQRALQQRPDFDENCRDIAALRWELDMAEMSRLLVFSTLTEVWQGGVSSFDVGEQMKRADAQCHCLRSVFGPEGDERKKILFIPDVTGGFVFDLMFIKALLRQGHQVILSLKDAFYFDSPVIWDLEEDKVLKNILDNAHLVTSDSITKNELLRVLREHRLVVISDGTAEQLNLYRTSVSFARAWKECDVVIAKGKRNTNVFIGSSHDFTRDIICYWRDSEGVFHIQAKPRAAWTHKFAEKYLLSKAKELVREMRDAHNTGKTIMFYSAIIGSLPRQTKTAIALVTAFVRHLREKLDNTYVINPAEHFEEGMDGDDLMYMWEYVQRSGLLDVWRFQTVDDIEMGFSLLERKIPSVWSGKDSTFSTGCTKEMRIALDEQQKKPELQIIGPAPEKFFRRRDYGVGKYYDATLKV